MIRFVMYGLLLAASAAGLFLVLHGHRRAMPRALAMAPAFVVTLLYAAVQVGRVLLFWAEGNWWQETPVSPGLAMMSNGVTLAWCLIGLLLTIDRLHHRYG